VGLRARLEADLEFALEETKLWGIAVELIDPETGVDQTQSANDATKLLSGQVLYDTRDFDPQTGADIIVHKPVVTLRRTSLDAIPERGWIVRLPLTPLDGAPLVSYSLERVAEDGGSIGFIRLYCGRLVQE
jgi:hypothetical protein